MKLQFVILALCVAVAMCASHCNQDSDCTCSDADGDKFPGSCVNFNCKCTEGHHGCTSEKECAVMACPNGHAKCSTNHGIQGHEDHKHCHC